MSFVTLEFLPKEVISEDRALKLCFLPPSVFFEVLSVAEANALAVSALFSEDGLHRGKPLTRFSFLKLQSTRPGSGRQASPSPAHEPCVFAPGCEALGPRGGCTVLPASPELHAPAEPILGGEHFQEEFQSAWPIGDTSPSSPPPLRPTRKVGIPAGGPHSSPP